MKKTTINNQKNKEINKEKPQYFNRGQVNVNFQKLKKLKITNKDPDRDDSIHSMNLTQLKKFALNKGVSNNDLKHLEREDLINLIEWPQTNNNLANIKVENDLNTDEQIRLIRNHLAKLNKNYEGLVTENSKLKELLGEYQFENNHKKCNSIIIVQSLVIFILIVISIIILAIKK